MNVAARVVETVVLRALRPDHGPLRALAAAASDTSRGGALWVALTAVAQASPRHRRAGREGLLAWAAASGTAQAVKAGTQRRRPGLVPRSGAAPRTSSMPSSHAAGAVAYATAATLRAPAAGLVTVPLAAAVAWSRAATGRHFPTDVAVGTAVGLAAGTAVHLARRGRRHRRRDAAYPSGRPERSRARGDHNPEAACTTQANDRTGQPPGTAATTSSGCGGGTGTPSS